MQRMNLDPVAGYLQKTDWVRKRTPGNGRPFRFLLRGYLLSPFSDMRILRPQSRRWFACFDVVWQSVSQKNGPVTSLEKSTSVFRKRNRKRSAVHRGARETIVRFGKRTRESETDVAKTRSQVPVGYTAGTPAPYLYRHAQLYRRAGATVLWCSRTIAEHCTGAVPACLRCASATIRGTYLS